MQLALPSMILAIVLTIPIRATAQPAPAPAPAPDAARLPTGAGGGQSGYSGGGGADPLRFKVQTLDSIRQKLAPSDEVWKSLSPKIERVMAAQRNARTGAGISFSTPAMVKGTPPPAEMAKLRAAQSAQAVQASNGPTIETPVAKAMQAIRAALDQQASDDELRKSMSAMREIRDKARAELTAAQKDLRDACVPRQEALFVTLGLLE